MNKFRRYRYNGHIRDTGFTIVELLLVLGIIAVLIVIALPMYRSFVDRAKIVQTAMALDTVRKDMEVYYNDNSRYPSSIDFTDFTDQSGKKILNEQTRLDLKKKVFSWESYMLTGTIYTLGARAKDSDRTLIIVTPQKVDY